MMINRDVAEVARVYKVLVVEDEILLRFVACEFLREAGYVVIEAASADEALPYIRSNSDVDLVFSDVRMPGDLDGIKLANQLANEFPEIKVILASGDYSPGTEVHVPFFRKPYDLDRVVDEITHLLSSNDSTKFANDL